MLTVHNFNRSLKDGNTIRFTQDYNIENPREAFSDTNRVKLYGAYGSGKVGDVRMTPSELSGTLAELLGVEDYYSFPEMLKMANDSDNLFIAPFYMMVHGGTSVSTHSFADKWDSGRAGFGIVCRDDIKDITFKDTAEFKAWAQECFEQEIKTYDDYLTENCWCYEILDPNGFEVDSCGGFYGDDLEENGMMEYIDPYLLPENAPKEQVFSFNCYWQMAGRLKVSAASLEEAKKKVQKLAQDCPLPSEKDYLEDSFEVDLEEGVMTEGGELV